MKRGVAAITLAFVVGFAALFADIDTGEKPGDLLPIPDKLVVLTFDDCNKSDRSFVADVVKEHGFGATFYVTEGLGFLRNKKHYTTWEEIVELDRMGFEIGNHTRSHPNVTRLSAEQVTDEIEHIEKRHLFVGGVSEVDTPASELLAIGRW